MFLPAEHLISCESLYKDPRFFSFRREKISAKWGTYYEPVKECILRGSKLGIEQGSKYRSYSSPYLYQIAYKAGFKFARSSKSILIIKNKYLGLWQVEKKAIDCFVSGYEDYCEQVKKIKWSEIERPKVINKYSIFLFSKIQDEEKHRALVSLAGEWSDNESILRRVSGNEIN
jgi:hypothetical protein